MTWCNGDSKYNNQIRWKSGIVFNLFDSIDRWLYGGNGNCAKIEEITRISVLAKRGEVIGGLGNSVTKYYK